MRLIVLHGYWRLHGGGGGGVMGECLAIPSWVWISLATLSVYTIGFLDDLMDIMGYGCARL